MKTFNDRQGRTWELSLNYSTVKRCRDAGLDVLDISNPDHRKNALACLHDDPIYLADVLWQLCQGQISQEKIDQADFGDAVMAAGEAARLAVLGELHDFFTRAAMENEAELVAKSLAARPGLLAAGKERLARLDATKLSA